jgi:hypothetical protein
MNQQPHYPNERRAQGTIEYLVIIAVVVVIALVVVGMMTGMLGSSSGGFAGFEPDRRIRRAPCSNGFRNDARREHHARDKE